MDQNYTISVADENGNTILGGEGPSRVLFYLSQVAVDTLTERGEDTESTVSIHQGEKKLLAVTIDSDSAAGLIKNRINRLRNSLKAEEAQTPATAA